MNTELDYLKTALNECTDEEIQGQIDWWLGDNMEGMFFQVYQKDQILPRLIEEKQRR
jgi:hypothetical protein